MALYLKNAAGRTSGYKEILKSFLSNEGLMLTVSSVYRRHLKSHQSVDGLYLLLPIETIIMSFLNKCL